MFEAKYLWKFLSISGKAYIIRIVLSRRFFFLKNGDHVICSLRVSSKKIAINLATIPQTWPSDVLVYLSDYERQFVMLTTPARQIFQLARVNIDHDIDSSQTS